MTSPINQQWHALQNHATKIKTKPISQLFAENPQRADEFSLQLNNLYFDYSKNLINSETIDLLFDWAESMQLPTKIEKLFSSEICNPSEGRAAMHWAMRSMQHKLTPELQTEIANAKLQANEIANKIRQQQWLGYDKQPITDILHVGIGGSALGPELLYEALSPYRDNNINSHFVANCDQLALQQKLTQLPAATTLILLVSKSFHSSEVLENADKIISWMSTNSADNNSWQKQTIAITANKQAAEKYGIEKQNIIPLWDWIGGRFSISSAVSLCIEICCGSEVFSQFLSGQESVDNHFLKSPLRENIPVLQALISLWYNHFFNATTEAIICYSQRLQIFPSYLQQLQMESLGKSVDLDGSSISYPTGLITWGGTGTQTQHSFHQLLMQGSHFIPLDFIALINNGADEKNPNNQKQNSLCVNAIAQAHTLMQGYKAEKEGDLAQHKTINGNQASNFILLDSLDSFNLGQLVSLYEHKVYAQGVMLNINPFDQWGVEKGKKVAQSLAGNDKQTIELDASSKKLWQLICENN